MEHRLLCHFHWVVKTIVYNIHAHVKICYHNRAIAFCVVNTHKNYCVTYMTFSCEAKPNKIKLNEKKNNKIYTKIIAKTDFIWSHFHTPKSNKLKIFCWTLLSIIF